MKLKVGDKARVRQWEDMAREGKIVDDGIDFNGIVFANVMKYLCGEEVTISLVHAVGYTVNYYIGVFTDEMLEPVEDYPLMENEEVWKWLGKEYNDADTFEKVFGEDLCLEGLTEKFSFEEVVRLVSKYEHEKHKFVPFNIKDLQSRMVIEYRNGKRYMVVREGDDVKALRDDGWNQIAPQYFERNYKNSGWDIVKVFNQIIYLDAIDTTQDVIWERKGE